MQTSMTYISILITIINGFKISKFFIFTLGISFLSASNSNVTKSGIINSKSQYLICENSAGHFCN